MGNQTMKNKSKTLKRYPVKFNSTPKVFLE